MTRASKRAIAACFGFVGGYTDMICYTRHHSMAVMMTGNMLLAGRQVAESQYLKVCYYVAIIACFCTGATVYRLVESRDPGRGASRCAVLCALLIAIAELFDFLLDGNKWLVCFLSPVFGVLNSVSAGGVISATTTMATGHFLSLSACFAKFMRRSASADDRDKAVLSVIVVLCIVAGIIVGDFIEDAVGQEKHFLFVPVAPMVVFLFCWSDRLTRQLAEEARKEKEAKEVQRALQEQESKVVPVPVKVSKIAEVDGPPLKSEGQFLGEATSPTSRAPSSPVRLVRTPDSPFFGTPKVTNSAFCQTDTPLFLESGLPETPDDPEVQLALMMHLPTLVAVSEGSRVPSTSGLI